MNNSKKTQNINKLPSLNVQSTKYKKIINCSLFQSCLWNNLWQSSKIRFNEEKEEERESEGEREI